jgi:hypothetical protein
MHPSHTARAVRRLAIGVLLLIVAGEASAQGAGQPRWFKGNTHTHTLNSDGDSPPDVVAGWYRDNGYQFVVITDHEFLTDVASLNARFGAPGTFLVIRGQEVTQILPDSTHPDRRRQGHVNAINTTRVVMPQGGGSLAESYARNLAAIRAAGGLAQVNHPNWRWSVRLSDMATLPDSTIFEIRNGHPGINSLGGTDAAGNVALSTEALWDSLLTRGKVMFGVGTDDSHYFTRPWDRSAPRPGQAWIFVRAAELTPEAIVGAMRRGDFYASTGVTLGDYRVEPRRISITIVHTRGASADTRFRTEFIGRGGRVLADVHGLNARYDIRGNEGYVRARITDSNGLQAWTQPVMIAPARAR